MTYLYSIMPGMADRNTQMNGGWPNWLEHMRMKDLLSSSMSQGIRWWDEVILVTQLLSYSRGEKSPKLKRGGHSVCQSRGWGPSLTCLAAGLWWFRTVQQYCWIEHLYMAFPHVFWQHGDQVLKGSISRRGLHSTSVLREPDRKPHGF